LALEVVEKNWWRRGDSNAGPRDYETLQPDFEKIRNILKDFDYEEDTLP